jgi:uncharacterized protein (DUF1330 family)
MTKGYVILTESIHDQAGMQDYAIASYPSLQEHGAKILVVEPEVEVLEGEWHGNRTVVVEFDSVEAAREWYRSAAYQAALPLRLAASQCNVVITGGFVHRIPQG